MNNPLSREARDAIRARAEAATPGPWEYGGVASIAGGSLYGEGWMIAAMNYEVDLPCHSGAALLDNDFRTPAVADANGEFIACARSDIPALLDALEAAEAERDALAEVFEDSYPMAYTEWIEVRNAWKRRAERAEALVSTLGSALERTDNNFQAILAHSPVRDATETLAEARAALEAFRAFTERAPAQMRAGLEHLRESRKINEAEWRERAEDAEKRLQRQLDANTALHARAMLAESERDRFYGLWELEATRAVRAEGDNFLHAWDLAKVKVERDALRAALASIRDDNVSTDLWLRQKANDALAAFTERVPAPVIREALAPPDPNGEETTDA